MISNDGWGDYQSPGEKAIINHPLKEYDIGKTRIQGSGVGCDVLITPQNQIVCNPAQGAVIQEEHLSMKRILSLLLSLITFMSFFSGCSSGKDDGDSSFKNEGFSQDIQPLVVFYPVWSEGYTSADRVFRAAARIFTERYGIEVEIYPAPTWEELKETNNVSDNITDFQMKMAAEMMAGKGPDVFIAECNSFGEDIFSDLYKKIDAGYFCDLNELIETDPDFDLGEYNPIVMDAGLYKGKRYIMPLSYQVPLLLVTEEKLTEFGFSADAFSTYERFQTSWEALHVKGKRLTMMGSFYFLIMMSAGWFDECLDFENGSVDLEKPSFKQMMDLMSVEEQITKGNYDLPLAEFIDPETDKDAIASAKVSGLFYLADVGVVSYVGELSDNFPGSSGEVLMLSVPNAFGNAVACVDDFCMISEQSKNKQAAWNFVKIMLSEEMQGEKWWEPVYSRGTPVRNGCADTYIDSAIDGFEKRYREKVMDVDADWLKGRAKEIHRSIDNAVLSGLKGYMVYQKMLYYIYTDEDFDKVKAEAENYFKIYLSE